jgi:hypothetical protein
MLPECRTYADCFSVPIFTLNKNDVDDFIDELRTFHGEFRDWSPERIYSDIWSDSQADLKGNLSNR